MSGTANSDAKAPMEQPNEDLSEVMGQLSVNTDSSDENSTPPKNLSDMPVDVVGLIIGRSGYKEQLVLRKTSKSLRTLVDKQQPACSRLSMSCMSDFIISNYDDHCVAYVPPNWNSEEFSSHYKNCRLDKIVSLPGYEKVAFDDLAFTLKNSKLQLECFSFGSEELDDYNGFDYYKEFDKFGYGGDRNWKIRSSEELKKVQKILKSLNHKVSGKECRIDVSNSDKAMSILPYLKPGVLEKIKLFYEYDDKGWRKWCDAMKQVALLEQWKQAEELELECGFDEEFPAEHATHFKRFQFDENLLYPGALVLIRDYLMMHKNVEFCSIPTSYLITDLFGRFDDIVGTAVSPNLYHYTIPDSEYYLEFMIEDKLVTIEKKKK
ncbi:unnamed protein product [Caenorhabditis brenneri]